MLIFLQSKLYQCGIFSERSKKELKSQNKREMKENGIKNHGKREVIYCSNSAPLRELQM
jgi:hypothetical protein